jgi:hypothetical protein
VVAGCQAARPSTLDRGALGRGTVDVGQGPAPEDMPILELRVGLCGHNQERHSAVVRYAGVREPGKGAELLCPHVRTAAARQKELPARSGRRPPPTRPRGRLSRPARVQRGCGSLTSADHAAGAALVLPRAFARKPATSTVSK